FRRVLFRSGRSTPPWASGPDCVDPAGRRRPPPSIKCLARSHPDLHDQVRLLDLARPLADARRHELHLVVRVRVEPLVDLLVEVGEGLGRELAVKTLDVRRAGAVRVRRTPPLLAVVSRLHGLPEGADLRLHLNGVGVRRSAAAVGRLRRGSAAGAEAAALTGLEDRGAAPPTEAVGAQDVSPLAHVCSLQKGLPSLPWAARTAPVRFAQYARMARRSQGEDPEFSRPFRPGCRRAAPTPARTGLSGPPALPETARSPLPADPDLDGLPGFCEDLGISASKASHFAA